MCKRELLRREKMLVGGQKFFFHSYGIIAAREGRESFWGMNNYAVFCINMQPMLGFGKKQNN